MIRQYAKVGLCMMLTAGCQRQAVVAEPQPGAQTKVADPVEPEQPADTSVVQYHRDPDHGPRVYLPLDSSPCQADEAANVTYLPEAIWRFDGDVSEWVAVEFGTADHWRIACNAMADLADIAGIDLGPGTYAIVAKVDGKREHGVIYEGPAMCNDVHLGEPPAGQVALCILSETDAEARFVPDPAQLSP